MQIANTSYPTFRYINHTNKKFFLNEPYTAMTSFAIDDALAIAVSEHLSPPAMRLWVHPDTIVLGIPDSRLPYLADGIQLLRNRGFHVIVRNSGGLAVALDDGVLNISLVLPGVKHISISECYEAMVNFVQYMLRDFTNEIEAYEIIGSYCPGDYDLSINGKKFAGISQRRIKDGAAIQIYLDVKGNSVERATLIRDFYDTSHKDEATTFDYPKIIPETMASLSELLGEKLTVSDMVARASGALNELCENVVETEFSERELEFFRTRFAQMKKRNEKIMNILG